jgi:hypothetical protein
MTKTLIRGLMPALVFLTMCGVASRTSAAPANADEGKNLTRAPDPTVAGDPGECNRDCLYAFVDKYFEALLSRCPCNMAMAPGAKYTENEVVVKPGEGIWKTFSGRGTYRVYLADPASGEAGYYGDITEFGGVLSGVVALRMKVKNHRVTELEVITVREQKRPKAGLGLNTAGIMTPRMLDELDPGGFVSPNAVLLEPLATPETREQLVGAAKGYYDGYAESKGSVAPFDARCARRENGMAVTNNSDGPVVDKTQPAFHLFSGDCAQELDRGFFSSIAKVRDARPLVVDEKQGLVLDLAFFDNEGDAKSVAVPGVGDIAVPAEFRRAYTFMAPQLFKIEGGKIREIEGLSWAVPFGMRPAAWEK